MFSRNDHGSIDGKVVASAQAVTSVSANGAPAHLHSALSDHFPDQQAVDLTLAFAQMNTWNRLEINFGHVANARAE